MRRGPRLGLAIAATLGLALHACGTGEAGAPEDPKLPGTVENLPPPTPAISGLRRLSNRELADTIALIVPGISADSILPRLSLEALTPFDNDYTKQSSSQALVNALDGMADAVTKAALASPTTRAALVTCTPSKVDDIGCLSKFIQTFGRRALRRPLAAEEVSARAKASDLAVRAGDFWVGVEVAMRALLQDTELVYRVELGEPVAGRPGVFKLTSREMATRIAFTLEGRGPEDWLLDAGDKGDLATPAGVSAAAARILAGPRASAHLVKFHHLWLTLKTSATDTLVQDMFRESDALVATAVTGDHLALLKSNETFVNARLADHYGLAPPAGGFPAGGWAWVPYGPSPRAGILGHGAVLANGGKFGDTSPVIRGKYVSERLLCRFIGAPPPEVNVDDPPPPTTGGNCKRARYAKHGASAKCASCHKDLDAIGFGLEQFDSKGLIRATEPNEPTCAIDGRGTIDGRTFVGVTGLAQDLETSRAFEQCAVTQLFRYTFGRVERTTDDALLRELRDKFTASGRRLDHLMGALVNEETFGYRTEEQP